MLSSLYGGRIAEQIIYGDEHVTTGASNDIERATAQSHAKMVHPVGACRAKMGPLLYAEDEGQVFLGRSVAQNKQMSDDTMRAIDAEIREVIDRNYDRAKKILEENVDILHAMKDALMKYETLDAGQIDDLMERRDVREPSNWHDKNDSDKSSGDAASRCETEGQKEKR